MTSRFRCPVCYREFLTFIGLRTHFYRVHVTCSRCPLCGKKFKTVRHLRVHESLLFVVAPRRAMRGAIVEAGRQR